MLIGMMGNLTGIALVSFHFIWTILKLELTIKEFQAQPANIAHAIKKSHTNVHTTTHSNTNRFKSHISCVYCHTQHLGHTNLSSVTIHGTSAYMSKLNKVVHANVIRFHHPNLPSQIDNILTTVPGYQTGDVSFNQFGGFV